MHYMVVAILYMVSGLIFAELTGLRHHEKWGWRVLGSFGLMVLWLPVIIIGCLVFLGSALPFRKRKATG